MYVYVYVCIYVRNFILLISCSITAEYYKLYISLSVVFTRFNNLKVFVAAILHSFSFLIVV